MGSLGQTIDRTLSNIGRTPRDVLLETLASFENFGLPDEERVAAIATAVAASAVSYHGRHTAKFLDAVQVWALEAADCGSPPVPRISYAPEPSTIMEAGEILLSGLDSLLDALKGAEVPLQDRVVSELALYTRLLGQHDVNTILLVVGAVGEAIADPDFTAGTIVTVALRDPAPFDRTADLSTIQTRGVA